MPHKILLKLIAIGLLSNLTIQSTASAITLRGSCYVTSTRSRVTAAVSGQKGSFVVTVLSGDNIKSSKIKLTNIYNVVTFAFDSEPLVYSAGKAIAIPPNFIQNNSVIIRYRDGITGRLYGSLGPICKPF